MAPSSKDTTEDGGNQQASAPWGRERASEREREKERERRDTRSRRPWRSGTGRSRRELLASLPSGGTRATPPHSPSSCTSGPSAPLVCVCVCVCVHVCVHVRVGMMTHSGKAPSTQGGQGRDAAQGNGGARQQERSISQAAREINLAKPRCHAGPHGITIFRRNLHLSSSPTLPHPPSLCLTHSIYICAYISIYIYI